MSKNKFFARFGDSDDIAKALNDEHSSVWVVAGVTLKERMK